MYNVYRNFTKYYSFCDCYFCCPIPLKISLPQCTNMILLLQCLEWWPPEDTSTS